MIRKKGLLLVGILLGIFLVIYFVFSDTLLEHWIEKLASHSIGAKVEIDNLDVSLLSTSLKWDRIQVTHPERTMKNMIETGPVVVDFSLEGLLKRKFIIEKIHVTNIQTFTDRATDGALPEKKKKAKPAQPGFVEKKISFVKKEITQAPALQLPEELTNINTKKIIESIPFQTPQKIDSLKKYYMTEFDKWKKEINNDTLKNEIEDIQKELKKIKAKNIKKLNELKKALENIKGVLNRIKKLKRKYQFKQKEFQTFYKSIEQSQKEIQQWMDEDYSRVKNYAKIPDLSHLEIGKFLLGPRLINYYQQYVKYTGYLSKVQKKLQSDKPEKENPPRLRGQDIYFIVQKTLPVFWIQEMVLSGKTNGDFSLSGFLKDFTVQPELIGKPIILQAKGTRSDGAKYELNWKHYFTEDNYSDSMQFSLENLPMKHFPLQNQSHLLPLEIEKSKATFTFTSNMREKEYNAKILVRLKHPKFSFSEKEKLAYNEERVKEIVRKTFENIPEMEVSLTFKMKNDKTVMQIKSNIDVILSARLKKVLGEETRKAEKRLRDEFDKKIAKYVTDFRSWLEQNASGLNKDFGKYSSQLDNLEELQKAKKKEIEKEIRKKASGFLNKYIK